MKVPPEETDRPTMHITSCLTCQDIKNVTFVFLLPTVKAQVCGISPDKGMMECYGNITFGGTLMLFFLHSGFGNSPFEL